MSIRILTFTFVKRAFFPFRQHSAKAFFDFSFWKEPYSTLKTIQQKHFWFSVLDRALFHSDNLQRWALWLSHLERVVFHLDSIQETNLMIIGFGQSLILFRQPSEVSILNFGFGESFFPFRHHSAKAFFDFRFWKGPYSTQKTFIKSLCWISLLGRVFSCLQFERVQVLEYFFTPWKAFFFLSFIQNISDNIF